MSILSKLFGGGSDEGRIQRRDDLFRSAFDQAPVGIAFVGRDGQWLQFNDRFVKLLGFPAEELVRTSLRELTHPDDRKIEAPHMRRLMNGDIPSYTITKRLLQRNKKYGSFRVHVATCSKGGDFEYYEYVISQATEESGSASPPADIFQLYEQLFEKLEDIAVIRSSVDGTLLSWNRGAEKIFGYKPGEIIRKPRSLLYRDADTFEGRPDSDLQQAVTQGSSDHEYWRVSKDGFALWSHVTLYTMRSEGSTEIVEFIRQPSHVKNAPAKDALRHRSEQQLAETRAAYDSLKAASEETIEKLRARIHELEDDGRQWHENEMKLRKEVALTREGAEKTFRELKIMTEALKKELQRRKDLEGLLTNARAELEASNERWKSELDRALVEREEAIPLPAPIDTGLTFASADAAAFESALLGFVDAGASGVIVARRSGDQIELHLAHGIVTACTSNLDRLPLGEALVASGEITEEQRDRALDIQRETALPLGRILLIINALTAEQLTRMMEERTRREIAELKTWEELDFAFVLDAKGSEKLVPLHLDARDLWTGAGPSAAAFLTTAGAPVSVDNPPIEAQEEEEVILATSARRDPEETTVATVTVTSSESTQVTFMESPLPAEEVIPDVKEVAPALKMGLVGNNSKRSRKFHRPDCKLVGKIPAKARESLADQAAAAAAGFAPCSACFRQEKRKRSKRKANAVATESSDDV